MVTFLALLVTIVTLLIAGALIILAGGAGFILAFADVIVCGLIIGLIIKLFRRRK